MGQTQQRRSDLRGEAKAGLAVAGLLCGLGLLLAPAPASAAKLTHVFLEDFGSAHQPSFARAQGLAVDQSSGDLYVIDGGSLPAVLPAVPPSLSRFKPNGEPDAFSALASNVIDGKGPGDEVPGGGGLAFGRPVESQVAIDNSCFEHEPEPLTALTTPTCAEFDPADGDIYITQPFAKALDVFAPSGAFLKQLTKFKEGPSAEGPEASLGEACGVAVDPSGDVYVGDFFGQIHKYEPKANPVENADSSANFPLSNQCTLAAGAGPTAGFIFPAELVDFGGQGRLFKLDAGSGAQKYVVDPAHNRTETVDPATGHLYTAIGTEVREYDAAGAGEATLLSSFSRGGEEELVGGIAADPASGEVYVSRHGHPQVEVWSPPEPLPEAITEAASAVGGETATLHGKAGAAGGLAASCEFQYITKAAFEEDGFAKAASAPCSPPGPFTGSGLEAVSAALGGLSPGTSYRFRVVAESKAGSNPERGSVEGALSFKTLGPAIEAESVSEIGVTAATIGGQVNPNGEATTFAVQYVSAAEFEKSGYNHALTEPAPPEAIGSGGAPVEVSRRLAGLAPATAYHYRLLASAPAAPAHGPDQSFATYPPEAGLPDGRAYEMVSPPQKAGEVFPPEPSNELGGSCRECLPGLNEPPVPMQSAPSGNAVLYAGEPFTGGLASGTNEYLGERGGAEWSSEGLSPPQLSGRYEDFSAGLSQSILYQIEPPLSPQAPARGGQGFADFYLRSADGTLRPLISEEPPHRDPGAPNQFSNIFDAVYAGANAGTALVPGFSRFLVEANDALSGKVEGIAPAAPAVAPGEQCANAGANCNLYEWEGGKLALVNVLPGNAAAAGRSTIGSGRLLATGNPQYQAPDVEGAISADGSRVFWSSEETGQVYARIEGRETLQIPGPASCKASVELKQRSCFLTASADGSKVLLSNGEIYELNEAGSAYVPSADLTLDEGEAHQGGFEGILGATGDLSHLYFVDRKALTGENAEGRSPNEGGGEEDNLYSWAEGEASFVGTLGKRDDEFGVGGRYGAWGASPPNRTAQVSADGGFVAFMSQAPLTGYDNAVRGGGRCRGNLPGGCFEVFEYAAGTESLACASCNPSGQRPLGPSSLSLIRPGTIGYAFPPFPQPGNLSAKGEGRLFFESLDALSPNDTNGRAQDVYEWEPDGVGSCESRSDQGGCVLLVSSGHSPGDSMFLDSTPSGSDAFFITRSQLLPRDRDEQLDLYDARAGGGFEEATTPPCLGEACKGPGTAPGASPSPGSAGFAGPGNEQPKHKKPNKHKKRRKHRRAAKHGRGGAK